MESLWCSSLRTTSFPTVRQPGSQPRRRHTHTGLAHITFSRNSEYIIMRKIITVRVMSRRPGETSVGPQTRWPVMSLNHYIYVKIIYSASWVWILVNKKLRSHDARGTSIPPWPPAIYLPPPPLAPCDIPPPLLLCDIPPYFSELRYEGSTGMIWGEVGVAEPYQLQASIWWTSSL